MNFNHIIFDLDGVLVDAVDIHANAFIDACDKCDIIISKEFHNEILNGLPTRKKLEILNIHPSLVNGIIKYKNQITDEKFNLLKPDNELITILSYLKTNNYKVSCATNSIPHTTHLILYRLGIKQYFDCIMTNADVEEAKPSPEIYYRCMLHNKVWINETLVIEDSPVGERAIITGGLIGKMIPNRKALTLEMIKCLNQQ